jgi:hypothetical protein
MTRSRDLSNAVALGCLMAAAIAHMASAQPNGKPAGSNESNAAPYAAPATTADVAPQTADARGNDFLDGLRSDSRWPDIKKCIEDTKTPTEYQACLQNALLNEDKRPPAAPAQGRKRPADRPN